uniref:Uncharacterized protein n=1 Tax=Ananas comosus var. bracteatus TaxID=296719 RepID=A0A6V7QBB4_ANACO|nr:unnamed protein product [Ananas comosus var. bracteatus]
MSRFSCNIFLHRIPDLHDDDDDDDQEDHLKRPLREDHPKTPSQLLSCFSLLTLPSCSKLQPDSAARRRRRAEGRALRAERLLGAWRDLGAFVDAELARLRASFVPRPRSAPATSRASSSPRRRGPPARRRGPRLARRPVAPLRRPLPPPPRPRRARPRPLPARRAPPRALRALAEAARSLRAHEAALDAEVAEYQATCILKLDFAEAVGGRRRGTKVVVEAAAEEMRKMGKIVRKAGKLRYQAVEVAAKGCSIQRRQQNSWWHWPGCRRRCGGTRSGGMHRELVTRAGATGWVRTFGGVVGSGLQLCEGLARPVQVGQLSMWTQAKAWVKWSLNWRRPREAGFTELRTPPALNGGRITGRCILSPI